MTRDREVDRMIGAFALAVLVGVALQWALQLVVEHWGML